MESVFVELAKNGGPTALVVLAAAIAVKVLWEDNKKLREMVSSLQEQRMQDAREATKTLLQHAEKSYTALTECGAAVEDNTKAIEAMRDTIRPRK